MLAVIRSSGERTTELCQKLVLEEIPKDNTVIICEAPFTNAIKKTFELGIERGLPWTLAIDADLLIRANAIKDLLQLAKQADDKVFELQGLILDKLFLAFRPGGGHLYRTSLLHRAIEQIPHEEVSGRPETTTLRNMESQGHPWILSDIIFGIHDYEQYYRDIYRKGFQHGKKHRRYIPYLEPLWQRLGKEDPDYLVASQGLSEGKNYEGPFNPDARDFKHRFKISLERFNLIEKENLSSESMCSMDVTHIIELFELPTEHSELVKIRDNYGWERPSSWYKRVSAAIREKGPGWIFRRLIKKRETNLQKPEGID
mgnify:CR=1 FL=1